MKKAILLIFGFLFITSYAGAQVLENFETSGSMGIYVDEKWGSLTDSIYQTTDPTGKTTGVLDVHFNLKGDGVFANNAIGLSSGKKGQISTNGAHSLCYWIYIPSGSTIPDSLIFGKWFQASGNWTWNEVDIYAKNIPKGVWYPIYYNMLDSSVANPTNNDLSTHNIGDAGLQWNNGSCANVAWSGDVYIDNISFIGAKPNVIDNFETSGSMGIYVDEKWGTLTDSIYQTADPTGKSTGVLAVHFNLKGDGVFANNAIGLSGTQKGQISAAGYHLLSYSIYIPSGSTIPDSLIFGKWFQPSVNWAWNEVDMYAKDIPKGVWFPVYYYMLDSSIASPTNNDISTHNIGDCGIQWNNGSCSNVTWAGDVYIDDISLLNEVVKTASSWTAADFEKKANGIQAFDVPAGNTTCTSLTRILDSQTANGSYVLQANVDFSKGTTFVVKRDSIPLLDATDPTQYATQVSFGVYFFKSMTQGALVDFAIDGPATGNNWVHVESKLDNSGVVRGNQWNTLTLNLDSLVKNGVVNPAKVATIAVQISYPGDTTKWAGKILFDNLVFTGIAQPSELPTPVLDDGSVVKVFKLYNNYPNPFNPSTLIKYDLPKELNVTLKVYDVLGREVTTLVNNKKQIAGSYSISFNASKYASGVYIYKITAGDYVKSYKMMLLK